MVRVRIDIDKSSLTDVISNIDLLISILKKCLIPTLLSKLKINITPRSGSWIAFFC